MTIHLRGIHAADHFRADVRAARRVKEGTTETLRAELADRMPLRWPITITNHSTTRKDI